MTETGFFSKNNLKRKILPFLFTAVITSAILKDFLGNNFDVISLISAVMTVLLFAAYDYVAAHKRLGPLVYIAMGITVLIVMSTVMSTVPRGYWFMEWFLTGGQTVDDLPQFVFIVLLGFTFFISSVVYYFTHIIYRVSILTLVSLIPCAIYVKAAQAVPVGYAVLLAAMNIFVYVYQNRNIFAKKHKTEGKAAEITAYVDFAVAAVLLALIIPKPSEAPYYERFEEFTNRFTFGKPQSGITGEYTEHSGNADSYNEIESKLLFLVNTQYPQYTKIQTYDIYEPENRWWVYGSGATKGYKDWEEARDRMCFGSLLEAYKDSESVMLGKVPEDVLSSLSAYEDVKRTAVIRAVDFPTVYALSPIRITDISFYNNTDIYTYRAAGGELWPFTHLLGPDDGYTISYYDNNYVRESGWLTSGLCDIDYDEYGEVLNDLYNDTWDYELSLTAEAFLNDWQDAEKYSPENYAPVSEELSGIAASLTEGLNYDYEKAAAIEGFFQSGNFLYDLAYRAPEEDDTPEFFVTQSRRGTCSDFATAYCLIARAAGLRVRYVEGFNNGTEPENDPGTLLQLYTENAHAYPEVYIPGAGWVIYEPTVVGGGRRGSSEGGEAAAGADYLTITVTFAALLIIILPFIALIIFMPAISEKIFGLKVRFASAEKGILLIYGRFSKQCARLFGISAASMTAEQLSDFTAGKTGIVPSALTDVFERVCYGNGSADKAECAEAYRCYKDCIKLMKKARRAKKKK